MHKFPDCQIVSNLQFSLEESLLRVQFAAHEVHQVRVLDNQRHIGLGWNRSIIAIVDQKLDGAVMRITDRVIRVRRFANGRTR